MGKAVEWWNSIDDHTQKDVMKLVGLKRKIIPDAEAGKGRFVIDFLNARAKEYGKPYASSVCLALCVKT